MAPIIAEGNKEDEIIMVKAQEEKLGAPGNEKYVYNESGFVYLCLIQELVDHNSKFN